MIIEAPAASRRLRFQELIPQRLSSSVATPTVLPPMMPTSSNSTFPSP